MKSHLFGWKPVFRYLLVLFMLTGANLYGATHTVSNGGGLSDAITAVNGSGTDDTITFTGNIELEAALPDISKATGTLTIEGNGYTLSRDPSASAFRVLTINAGDVTIDRLTISGGYVSTDSGGGIVNNGTLTLTNCTVSGNTAGPWGGGIYSRGTLTLTDCTVSGNTADMGGGIYSRGTLTLTNCTVSGNMAGHDGGGIYSSGTLTLTNCTVSGNMAAYGGGIHSSGTLTLTNCTVSGNMAAYGGGIHSEYGTLTLIRNIVSGNTAANGSEIYREGGSISANAHNVFGNSDLTTAEAFVGFTPGATDVTCTSDAPLIGIHRSTALDSILSPLADNGGPTLTHALVAGSPAIDIASDGPDTDQRGISRPQGSGVDAGAYEYVPLGPEPEPEPILEWSYSHSLVSNTAKLNAWVLDPDARLGVGANWIMEGDLSRGFRFVDGMLVGMFDTTGIHTFRISGTDGIITVNHTFTVRVMAPTVCPTIFGAWINGDYLSIEVLEDARHGVAAQTAPMQMTLEQGQSTDIRFDWDYIKDGFGFCIIDGALPPGLILDGRSGVISGVPSASGSYRFLVSVKDWRGRGYQWIEVNIP